MRKNNEEFVAELMASNGPTGPLVEVFIIEAIRAYSEQVANAEPIPDSAILSGVAWKRTGVYLTEQMNKRLNAEPEAYVAPQRRFLAVADFDDCDNQHGMFCPECGRSDQIDVSSRTDVRLTLDGTDDAPDGSHTWDDDSVCTCGECGFQATVADFTPNEDELERSPEETVARNAGWVTIEEGGWDGDLICHRDTLESRAGPEYDSWQACCIAQNLKPEPIGMDEG